MFNPREYFDFKSQKLNAIKANMCDIFTNGRKVRDHHLLILLNKYLFYVYQVLRNLLNAKYTR